METTQQISENWRIDVPGEYVRRESDDGFTIFSRGDAEFSAILYGDCPHDSWQAIDAHFGRKGDRDSASPIEFLRDGPPGKAVLRASGKRDVLHTATAVPGRILQMVFLLGNDLSVQDAVRIWKSLRYVPPPWTRLCEQLSPPLVELRDALESDIGAGEAADVAFCSHGPAEILSVLREALRSDSPVVRRAACDAIACSDHMPADLKRTLSNLLNDRHLSVRASAAEVLWEFGAPASLILPALIDGLRDGEPPLPRGEARIEGICRCLRVPDRIYAVQVLGRLESAARPAKHALEKLRWDESGPVRLRVADSLLSMGDELAVVAEPLLAAVSDPMFSQRERREIADWLLSHGVPSRFKK